MTERTRQNIMIVFMGAVLALTVGAVWLFGAQRREKITALGQTIPMPELGFTVRMPSSWGQMPKGWGRIGAHRWLPANTLVYSQPLEPAVYDRNTRSDKKRLIFFIPIPPNATDKQILAPLDKLVIFWDINHNLFRYLKPEPFPFAPWRPDALGYERRDGAITFVHLRRGTIFRLIRYEQIKAQGQVFWCIMAGNTDLGIADKALLDVVADSFRLMENKI